jgi:hypothetical protein
MSLGRGNRDLDGLSGDLARAADHRRISSSDRGRLHAFWDTDGDAAHGDRRGRAASSVRVIGLLIAVIAAGLLFLGVIDAGPAALVGIIGLGLMGTSAAVSAAPR